MKRNTYKKVLLALVLSLAGCLAVPPALAQAMARSAAETEGEGRSVKTEPFEEHAALRGRRVAPSRFRRQVYKRFPNAPAELLSVHTVSRTRFSGVAVSHVTLGNFSIPLRC